MQTVRSISRLLHQLKVRCQPNVLYYASITAFFCFCIIGIANHSYESDDDAVDLNSDYFIDWQPNTDEMEAEKKVCTESSEIKTILLWNTYFGSSDYNFGLGQHPFSDAGCSCKRCQLTSNRELLKESDAIIFHSDGIDVNDMPPERYPHQKWIFYTFTPPVNHARLPGVLSDKFNWTMTYRRDSDIINRNPFGSIVSKSSLRTSYGHLPSESVWINSKFNRKKRLIAFIKTSACQQRPDESSHIVSELRKHISVDVYDKCKRKTCGDETQCNEMLRRDYKFVLVLESSLCTDYVSERLYSALQSGAVPVVYGQADYDAYAPANSYINAADFRTVKKLTEFLLMLESNEGLYNKYLSWSRDYAVDRYPKIGWCRLCDMVNTQVAHQFYADINKWWFDDAQCPTSYPHSISHNHS